MTIKTVAVVGAGVIGASWAELFREKGLDVRVHDPARPGPSLAEAVQGAQLVQECAPDDLALKRRLFAELAVLAPDALLCSSTSSIPATELARELDQAAAARVLVAHPFNPPRLIPLVELVPGERTSPEALERARAFYAALGKKPVILRKETPGFAANRLQAALLKEALALVAEGVVTVPELDAVVVEALGPRWAAAGPFETFHLGGGPGGLAAFFKHFGPALKIPAPLVELVLRQAAGFAPYAERAPRFARQVAAVLAARRD